MIFNLLSSSLLLAVLYGPILYAQTAPGCQSRALRSVDEAIDLAGEGKSEDAPRLLAQADRDCGTSWLVLQKIGEAYGLLGDSVKKSVYLQRSHQMHAGLTGASDSVSLGSQPSLTASSVPPAKSFVRAKYALVVGVGDFASPKIPHLKFSAKDAQDFANALTDSSTGRFFPENVTVLTNSAATARAIRSSLAAIAAKALPDDLVVLYFSTHGSSPAMDRSKVAAGYLVTYDTEVNDLYATAFGMDELARFIGQKLRAERIVTFLDTCYSGDTTLLMAESGGSKGLVDDSLSDESIGRIAQGKGSVVITSSTNRELSWESIEKQNSFFTLYLLNALRSNKGLSDVRQVYTELQRQLPSAVREYTRAKGLGENGHGASQDPAIYPISNIPDIVIGTPVK